MNANWLSVTWEPHWRSFQYFNFYRLVVAFLLILTQYLQMFGLQGSAPRLPLAGMLLAYLLLVAGGTLWSLRRQVHFNRQLSAQMLLDIAAVGYLIVALGGISSGMGVLLMISLAAASLVGRGRLVLLYAALATVMVLGVQIHAVWRGEVGHGAMLAAALLSTGFFATAILARLLGQRLMSQEDLARRRGAALDNQMRIGRRILERMQDGVLVVDGEGMALRHNPEAEDLLGLPSGDALPLATHAPTLALALARWAKKGGPAEVEIAGVNGRRLGVRFEATDSGGGESLVFLEDLSRVQERARQLKLAALGRLTASIAHEIRNPLAAISHATELLAEIPRPAVDERLLRIMRDNVFRLDRIVQDVLKLGGGGQACRESLSLAEFLPGFVEEFLAVEGTSAEVLHCAATPALLRFDRGQLLQVLWNLVGNAVRHCRQQKASVRLWVAGGADGRVELHIADDGPGIPDALREQVFEPFFTTRHEGTGLGLFVARELCEANGACLELLPADAGAHFVIVGENSCPPLPAAPVAP